MYRSFLGLVSLLALTAGLARADARVGAVFTVTNESGGNRVLAFARDAQGGLAAPAAFATMGAGSGDSLGSQGALALSEDHRFLLVVNAGSNEITSFAVRGASLELRDRIASGGARPISLTTRRGLVYVLNAGAPENVAGFFLDHRGRLSALPGATQPLSGTGVGAAQVELDPEARALVVTEKNTSRIDVFAVSAFGRLSAPTSVASAGTTPFGFEFTERGELIVSEAATASLSSYALSRRDGLTLTSSVVPDTQAAPCWVAVSSDDRYAFTANAGSASISSYTVGRDGSIALKAARAGEVGQGSRPLDMAVAADGRALYVLDRGNLAVVGFALGRDGSLTAPVAISGLTAFSTGLAGY